MKKIVAFVDNSFPVEGDIVIEAKQIIELVKLSNERWNSESNLKDLIWDIFSSDRYKKGEVELYGFQHPEKILEYIEEKKFNPDLIIYDWEYVNFSEESGKNLIEILKKTKAFVFIYSSFFDTVYPILNKSEFDSYSERFQLLKKGERKSTIFSSEEFIIQYFLGLFSQNNTIKLSNHEIKFNSSGYLENASGILYLESILGKEFILQNLNRIENEISEEKLEELFELVESTFYISHDKKNIIEENNELMNAKFGPLTELSYKEVLKKIGVKGIYKLLNSGIISTE